MRKPHHRLKAEPCSAPVPGMAVPCWRCCCSAWHPSCPPRAVPEGGHGVTPSAQEPPELPGHFGCPPWLRPLSPPALLGATEVPPPKQHRPRVPAAPTHGTLFQEGWELRGERGRASREPRGFGSSGVLLVGTGCPSPALCPARGWPCLSPLPPSAWWLPPTQEVPSSAFTLTPRAKGVRGGVQGGQSCPSPALCTSLGHVATPGRRWHGAALLQDRAQLHPLPCPALLSPVQLIAVAVQQPGVQSEPCAPALAVGTRGLSPPSGHRDLPQPEPGLSVFVLVRNKSCWQLEFGGGGSGGRGLCWSRGSTPAVWGCSCPLWIWRCPHPALAPQSGEAQVPLSAPKKSLLLCQGTGGGTVVNRDVKYTG